jgi:hypothetical protein
MGAGRDDALDAVHHRGSLTALTNVHRGHRRPHMFVSAHAKVAGPAGVPLLT